MKFLNLDDEQAAMLLDAADTSIKFLLHRSARIDPDGILSKAAELQAHKLANVRAQLLQPDLPAFADLAPADRLQILKFAGLLIGEGSGEVLDHVWRSLVAAIVSARLNSAPAEPEAHQGE